MSFFFVCVSMPFCVSVYKKCVSVMTSGVGKPAAFGFYVNRNFLIERCLFVGERSLQKE